jgi:predicted Zn finger-like uncharacterized protein
MLILCPSCATSYEIDPASLGEGRSMRCAHCRNVWFATASALAPAPAIDDGDGIDAAPPLTHAAPSESAETPEPAHALAEAAPAAEFPPEFTPEPGSAEDIDIAGLNAEMDAARAEQEAAADAVLAELTGETLAPESLPLVPEQAATTVEAQPDIAAGREARETFTARRARHEALRRRNWLKPGLSAAVVALAAANAIVVAWRTDIVRLLPQTASLYAAVGLPVNLRGLSFENIHMARAEQDGVAVLVVEGSIVNVTRRAVEVPWLRLAVRNEGKYEIYTWMARPTRTILGPGEALPFRSRLASPPAEAREVQVRFFTKHDLVVAGLN